MLDFQWKAGVWRNYCILFLAVTLWISRTKTGHESLVVAAAEFTCHPYVHLDVNRRHQTSAVTVSTSSVEQSNHEGNHFRRKDHSHAFTATKSARRDGKLNKPSFTERFLVLGAHDNAQVGLGNLLVYFPAAYYFALLTKRSLVIDDHSILGQFCRIVHCGVPLISELSSPFYTAIFTPAALQATTALQFRDFLEIFDNRQNNHEDTVLLSTSGISSRSDWWMPFPDLVGCVSQLTNCAQGDVDCAERYAMHQLITTALRHDMFVSSSQKSLEMTLLENMIVASNFNRNLTSVSNNILQKQLNGFFFSKTNRPNGMDSQQILKFDVADHLRNQFDFFEHEVADMHAVEVQREVQDWLASSECRDVFASIWSHLSQYLAKQGLLISNEDGSRKKEITVYLAGDNGAVKQALCRSLLRAFSLEEVDKKSSLGIVIYMLSENVSLLHTKSTVGELTAVSSNPQSTFTASTKLPANQASSKSLVTLSAANQETLLWSTIDWYALANVASDGLMLAWRRGSTTSFSTFVASAASLEGAFQRSHNRMGLNGNSSFSRALHLYRSKSGGTLHAKRFFSFNVDKYHQLASS